MVILDWLHQVNILSIPADAPEIWSDIAAVMPAEYLKIASKFVPLRGIGDWIQQLF